MVAVGIDFGNAYSCVGIWRNDSVDIVANDQGNRQNPSLVAFNDQEQLAGEAAKSQLAINPANTIYDIKFMLGRKFSDPAVQAKVKSWPFTVVAGKADELLVEVLFKGKKHRYSAVDLAGLALTELVALASKFLGSDVSQAVLSVPANFSDEQMAALRQAAAKAKVAILRTIKDPVAAAVGLGLDDPKQAGQGSQNLCVVDFGAGTCDVGLVGVDDGILTLKKHAQDADLSGKEFESLLVGHFLKTFERKTKAKIAGKEQARAEGRLRTVCQKALASLSSSPTASIELDTLFEGHDLYESISRARFEALAHDLLKGCVNLLGKVFSGPEKSQVSQVLLVGGCTRIPKLKAMISDFWGQGVLVEDTKNPNELIASGAALQAHLLEPHAKSPQLNTFPVLEATALSLGLRVAGGAVVPVVPRGSVLPCTRSVSLRLDNQQSATLCVYQGERVKAVDNSFLGSLELKDLPKEARGTEVTVVFSLDLQGELTVCATHAPSGKGTEKVLSAGKGKQDTATALAEAEKHKAADEDYFKRLMALRTLRVSVAEETAQPSNEASTAAAQSVGAWLTQCDQKDEVPIMSVIEAKKAEITAAGAEEEEESEDDEGDEGESDSEVEAPDDDDLDGDDDDEELD